MICVVVDFQFTSSWIFLLLFVFHQFSASLFSAKRGEYFRSFLHPPTFMNPFCRRMARSSAERIVILSHWKEPGTSGTETRQSCRTSFHHGGFHLPFPHFRLFRHTHPHRAVLSPPPSPRYILAYHHTPVDATLPPPFFTHCRPLQPRPFFLSTDSRTLLHAAPPIADADLSP